MTGVNFTPYGRILSSSRDRAVRIWHPATGRELRSFQLSEWATCADMSRDGLVIIASQPDGALHFFNADTGEWIHAFSAHEEAVNAVAYLPQSHRVITASEDRTAALWGAE